MYAAIRRYQIDPRAAELVIRRVNEDFVPLISQAPGFVAYYTLDAGDGALVSISIFEERAEAEASSRLAADWVSRKLGPLLRSRPVEPPEITAGEVVAQVVAYRANSPGAGNGLAAAGVERLQ